jgi:acyl carrier protein
MTTLELASSPTVADIVGDLLAIIRAHTKTSGEDWTGATTIEEAGIDSFDFVEMIFQIEDQYQIHVTFNSNAQDTSLDTVEDVARLVQTEIGKQRRAA